MLCYVQATRDELEKRRGCSGLVLERLIVDLENFEWSKMKTGNMLSPLYIFMRYIHVEAVIAAPLRRFFVRGIMGHHSAKFFVDQLRHRDTLLCIKAVATSISALQVTGQLYPDLLITFLVYMSTLACPNSPSKQVVSAIYALIDELLGYCFHGHRLQPVIRQHMPDISFLMPFIAVHCTNKPDIERQYPDADEDTLSLLVDLIEMHFKLMPFRCNNREFYCLMQQMIETKDKLLCEFVAKVLAASWLGVYDHCNVRTNLRVRIEVYRFLMNVTMLELKSFFTKERSITAMYMFKEYFCYMIDRCSGFCIANKTCNWKEYVSCTVKVCDNDIRALGSLAQSFFGFPVNTKRFAEAAHDEYRKWQTNTTVSYKLNLILEAFDNISFDMYPYDRCLYKPGLEHLMRNPRPLLPKGMLSVLSECVSAIESRRPDFVWLVCFGASMQAIKEMRQVVFGKIPELDRFLTRLSTTDPVSYSVLYSFFYLLYRHLSISVFPCDREMVISQTLAIARHYQLKDGDRIPDTAANFFVCENCGDIKQQSFYPKTAKTPTTGFGKIRIAGNGTITCARRPKPPDWQDIHFHEHGYHPEASHISRQRKALTIGKPRALHRKFAKHAASQHVLQNCITTPLTKVSALGCVAVYRNVPHICCYNCAKVVSIYEFRFSGTQLLCLKCIQSERKQVKQKDDTCVLCNSYRKGRMRTFYLYDDYPKGGNPLHQFRVREVSICATHNPLNWVVSCQIVYLSRVLYEIFQHCGLSKINGTCTGPSGFGPVSHEILDEYLIPKKDGLNHHQKRITLETAEKVDEEEGQDVDPDTLARIQRIDAEHINRKRKNSKSLEIITKPKKLRISKPRKVVDKPLKTNPSLSSNDGTDAPKKRTRRRNVLPKKKVEKPNVAEEHPTKKRRGRRKKSDLL